MTKLDRELTRLAKMRRELAAQERKVKLLAAAEARANGLLANPRIETLMQRVAA